MIFTINHVVDSTKEDQFRDELADLVSEEGLCCMNLNNH
jgi:hypothetical protein